MGASAGAPDLGLLFYPLKGMTTNDSLWKPRPVLKLCLKLLLKAQMCEMNSEVLHKTTLSNTEALKAGSSTQSHT